VASRQSYRRCELLTSVSQSAHDGLGACGRPPMSPAVTPEPGEALLAPLQPLGEPGALLLDPPDRAGVLLPRGAKALDRVVEAALGQRDASVGAADGLLQPVAQRGLVAIEIHHLVVADARGGPEELL